MASTRAQRATTFYKVRYVNLHFVRTSPLSMRPMRLKVREAAANSN